MSETKKDSEFNPIETISRTTGTPLESLEKLKKDLDTPSEARVQVFRMASILNLAERIMPKELIRAVPQMTEEQFKQFEQDTLQANVLTLERRNIRDLRGAYEVDKPLFGKTEFEKLLDQTRTK